MKGHGILTMMVVIVLLTPVIGRAQLAPGSMDVKWNEGSPECKKRPQAPLQVHPYNSQTFILRENLCSTSEAPFVYLLIGSKRALLIDTGDVADPSLMPLAKTVMGLLPGTGSTKLPLLVVHTHRHLDHRAGDGQFMGLPGVQIVGFDFGSVKKFYAFANWPDGLAQIDLGERVVDAIPTPGHNPTEVSFYDRKTGLFFSGDFFLPGRFLVDDTAAYIASAERVAVFVRDHPISNVLGGHIELNAAGDPFAWGSQHHPDEHVLQMARGDLLALPAAMRKFNGFYSRQGPFIMMNSIRILDVIAVLMGIALIGLVWMVIRYVRRRKRLRRSVLIPQR